MRIRDWSSDVCSSDLEEVILPDERECPCCGGALHCIDSDISSRLDVIPVQYRVIVTSRPRMACRACSDGVFQAPAPKNIVPGGDRNSAAPGTRAPARLDLAAPPPTPQHPPPPP